MLTCFWRKISIVAILEREKNLLVSNKCPFDILFVVLSELPKKQLWVVKSVALGERFLLERQAENPIL
jgi:hypothetical protein